MEDNIDFLPAASTVTNILNKKDFCFSAEIIPPRNGTNFNEVFKQIDALKKANFDFISVTHGAGGSLRGGTLPICYHTQHRYNLTSIAHLTVRGASKEGLENALIDHHYFGVRNILALRGDPPDGIGKPFKTVPGGFSYAHELITLIDRMNHGEYIPRKNFDNEKFRQGIKTDFCIGVACYPEDEESKRIQYLQHKVNAGASFAVTQMILDSQLFLNYQDEVNNEISRDFPLLLGLRIPNSLKMLNRLKNKFNIPVESALLDKMKNSKEEKWQETGLEWAKPFIEKAKANGTRGVHFFIMGDPTPSIEVKKFFD